jgi:hypothetical protein
VYTIASLFLVALAGLLLLPHLLYWLLWISTGRGLPPKSTEQLERRRNFWRPEKVWALKTVGVTAIGVGIYRGTIFLLAR